MPHYFAVALNTSGPCICDYSWTLLGSATWTCWLLGEAFCQTLKSRCGCFPDLWALQGSRQPGNAPFCSPPPTLPFSPAQPQLSVLSRRAAAVMESRQSYSVVGALHRPSKRTPSFVMPGEGRLSPISRQGSGGSWIHSSSRAQGPTVRRHEPILTSGLKTPPCVPGFFLHLGDQTRAVLLCSAW